MSKYQTDEERLEAKRLRNREAKRRSRLKNPEASREAAKRWREKNKDKIHGYNAKQWERTKADPKKLEAARKRNRIDFMPEERVKTERERKRKVMEEKRRKMEKEARALGMTLYEYTITPEAREKASERMAEWRKNNREKALELGRRHTQNYRDKRGKRASIDTYMYKMLRVALIARDSKSIYFPGYTGRDFKLHMAALLPEGWSFADYGEKWEIDHIIPRSAYEYESINDPEYQECWALDNLQPLCKIENRKKGGVRGGF